MRLWLMGVSPCDGHRPTCGGPPYGLMSIMAPLLLPRRRLCGDAVGDGRGEARVVKADNTKYERGKPTSENLNLPLEGGAQDGVKVGVAR